MGATRGLTTATIAAVAALTAVACSGGGSPGAHESPARATSTSSGPATGVIAIGHSGLTGAANDPRDIALDIRTNSWAIGGNRQVHSIAARLATAAPLIAHPVANTAVDGSTADQLDDELSEALTAVPRPALAIIQVVGNEIRCDGEDRSRVQPFAARVREAMQRVVRASPGAVVVAVPWVGRPVWRAEALLENDTATVSGEGTEPCSLLTLSGRLNRSGISRLTSIIAGYDSALRLACTQVRRCVYATAAARYVDHARDLARDWRHLAPSGHARLAALIWPTVRAALRL